MPPKTRQQRRAKSRSPLKRKRRGSSWFVVFLTILVVGGIGGIAYFRLNRPPLTRGAIAGEHWHASLKIFVCGKRMTDYPNIEGEIHSHGDGFMHIHPTTQTNELASLGTYLRTYQTALQTSPEGKTTLTFPDGKSYTDGDRCPKDDKRHDIVVTNKGEQVDAPPDAFLPHDGDAVVIRFGPEGDDTFPNPYSKVNQIPDVGTSDRTEPGPDTAPTTTGESGAPEETEEPAATGE